MFTHTNTVLEIILGAGVKVSVQDVEMLLFFTWNYAVAEKTVKCLHTICRHNSSHPFPYYCEQDGLMIMIKLPAIKIVWQKLQMLHMIFSKFQFLFRRNKKHYSVAAVMAHKDGIDLS